MPRMPASSRSSPARKANGASWRPGQSGNPKGRPPAQIDLSALVANMPTEAVAALVKALASRRTESPAAIALLDRGFGKPKQTIETNDPTSPILLHLACRATRKR